MTLDGNPVEGAVLHFYGATNEVSLFTTKSLADGTFNLSIPAQTTFEGGNFRVTAYKLVPKKGTKVELNEAEGMDLDQMLASGQATNSLPPIYANIESTPLKVDIKRGEKNTADIAMKGK